MAKTWTMKNGGEDHTRFIIAEKEYNLYGFTIKKEKEYLKLLYSSFTELQEKVQSDERIKNLNLNDVDAVLNTLVEVGGEYLADLFNFIFDLKDSAKIDKSFIEENFTNRLVRVLFVEETCRVNDLDPKVIYGFFKNKLFPGGVTAAAKG